MIPWRGCKFLIEKEFHGELENNGKDNKEW
jgi:hypothetical protein